MKIIKWLVLAILSILISCAILVVSWVWLASEPRMTYESFLEKFPTRCSDTINMKLFPRVINGKLYPTIDTQKIKPVCACLEKTIKERWPSMSDLHAGLHQLDREPRGNLDFFDGGMRIAVPYCLSDLAIKG
jgi:hypothetical protein